MMNYYGRSTGMMCRCMGSAMMAGHFARLFP